MNTQEMINMCNDDSTYRSLSKYIDTISNGKMKVTSYFPQLKDGVIQPYVLQQSREEYTDYNQYAVEMLQNIPVPEDIPLDGNFDGFVDNVQMHGNEIPYAPVLPPIVWCCPYADTADKTAAWKNVSQRYVYVKISDH